ncbi:MAG: hypothetical protein BroJett007_13370 [Chloroflexota bacterium]|nr:MAG: hypothetical protein BroJett007_13370 [Chloroflexota bacterium]
MTEKTLTTDLLTALSPDDLNLYFKQSNWIESGSWRDVATIWARDLTEVLIPKSQDFADYAPRVYEALSTLARTEQRPVLEVYNDIRESSGDTVRIRVRHPDSDDGSIPLVDGVKLYQATYEMLISAAAVVDQKRGYLPNRKPAEAMNYVQKSRIGQTEHGSYVIVVHSSLDDSSSATDDQLSPFGRRVLETLASTLASLSTISEHVDPDLVGEDALDSEVDDFVRQGGSVDFCDAIYKLVEGAKQQRVEVELSWSRAVTAPKLLPVSYVIDKQIADLSERLGNTVRRQWQAELKTVKGTVIRLGRESDEGVAAVTVDGEVDGRRRRVRIHPLTEEDHQLLIDAYRSKKRIGVKGMFQPRRNHSVLEDYRDLGFIDDPTP